MIVVLMLNKAQVRIIIFLQKKKILKWQDQQIIFLKIMNLVRNHYQIMMKIMGKKILKLIRKD